MGRRSYRRIGLHFRRWCSPHRRVLDWWFSDRDAVAGGHGGDGFWVFLSARRSCAQVLAICQRRWRIGLRVNKHATLQWLCSAIQHPCGPHGTSAEDRLLMWVPGRQTRRPANEYRDSDARRSGHGNRGVPMPRFRVYLKVLVAAKLGSELPRRPPVFVGAQFICAMGDCTPPLQSPSKTGLLHDC